MSIFKKLFTLGRKAVGDAEEALDQATIVDQLTQNLRDAKTNLTKADGSRIDLRAKRKSSERKVADLTETVAKWLANAKQAKAAENMDLAKQAITKMNTEQVRLDAETKVLAALEQHITALDSEYSKSMVDIERIEIELEQLKADKDLLDVQESLQDTMGTGRTSSSNALSSLAKAKEVQQRRRDKLSAANELNADDDLESKFADLGGANDVDDQLANL
jgi:phage shock protein A